MYYLWSENKGANLRRAFVFAWFSHDMAHISIDFLILSTQPEENINFVFDENSKVIFVSSP